MVKLYYLYIGGIFMHPVTLDDNLSIPETIDEIIHTFDSLVDSGNICQNVHTYFSGCCISDKMFWALRSRLLEFSNSLFLANPSSKSPLTLIYVTEGTNPRRIIHIIKGDTQYVFKPETASDIYLSLASEGEVAV